MCSNGKVRDVFLIYQLLCCIQHILLEEMSHTLLFVKKNIYSIVSVAPGKCKYIVPYYSTFLKGDLYFPFQMWFL